MTIYTLIAVIVFLWVSSYPLAAGTDRFHDIVGTILLAIIWPAVAVFFAYTKAMQLLGFDPPVEKTSFIIVVTVSLMSFATVLLWGISQPESAMGDVIKAMTYKVF